MRQKLPHYMVPAAFVIVDRIPLTANGKIDREALIGLESEHAANDHAYVEPRSALEERVSRIWREVLGRDRIGVTDNFFDIGGQSMAAVRIMAAIEREFGCTLPVSTIFERSTVEQLAKALHANEITHDVIVRMQPGDPGGPPLFCVHPAGGTVFCYAVLARHLPHDQAVYALQAASPGDGQDTPWRIEDMAARYLDAIREIHRDGPCVLAGWSFGGVVAFEMAQQLYARGRRDTALVMIDSWIPAGRESLGFQRRADWQRAFVADLAATAGKPIATLGHDLSRVENGGIEELLQAAVAHGLLPADAHVSQVGHLMAVYERSLRALGTYMPRPYHGGRVVLLRAGQGPRDHGHEPEHVWTDLIPGIEVTDIPGDHYSIMREPGIRNVASGVAALLSTTDARGVS